MGSLQSGMTSGNFKMFFIETNLPSEVILIKDISAGVPINAPVAPATMPTVNIKRGFKTGEPKTQEVHD